MSLSTLERFLKRHKQVGQDSSILIYFIESSPSYGKHFLKIFEAINRGLIEGICATLTLMEILVQPYRKNNEELVNQFYGLLTNYPHLTWVELTVEIADLGARLRAKYNLKTPDAILLASAIQNEATGFLCNDIQLKSHP